MSDKQKALETALEKIEKAYGKGSIMRLGQNSSLNIEAVSTGSISLDVATGIGGMPRGRIIEVYGPESSGKTTLAIHAIAEAQKQGGIAAIIDAEHAFDRTYAKNLGVNVDTLLISQPDNGEQALEIADNLIRSGAIDIIGFNYHEYQFEQAPHWYPGKPFIVSESVSSLHTRGHYLMPSDQDHAWPSCWDRPHEDSTFMCSAYDNCHAPWSSTHEKNLQYVKNLDYIAGQFIWTGFDYLGEPTPYGWPARSSYFGIVDLAGFPKDAYWLYQSEWTDDDVLHILPHWTWNVEGVAESQLADDGTIDVWAYYNHADEAELFINGVSQGIAHKDGKFHAMWRVHYEPGTIKVVTRHMGEVVCEQTLTTVGEPYAVRLTADRSRLAADGRDLSFVTVDIVDRDGNVCPWADDLVDFSVSGNAFIAGVDNGLQTSMESFKAPFRKAFHGKCLVVLQNDGNAGGATLKATAKGLKGDKLRVSFK